MVSELVDGSRDAPDWLDEVGFDPHGTTLAMGTKRLGSRPWLVIDDQFDTELGLKARLMAQNRNAVFGVEAGWEQIAEQAGLETLQLVNEAVSDGDPPLIRSPDGSGDEMFPLHPLEQAGLLAQEDFCLLRRADSGWVLAVGSVCFPARWRLSEKLGRGLEAVHGPVSGYKERLSTRVGSLLDKMIDRVDGSPVWRRNMIIHPNSNLFQPYPPPGGDPVIPADRCGFELFLRSERQTLRRLPESGWILFTIKTQQEPLDTVARARVCDLTRFFIDGDRAMLANRGVGAEQVLQLVEWLSQY